MRRGRVRLDSPATQRVVWVVAVAEAVEQRAQVSARWLALRRVALELLQQVWQRVRQVARAQQVLA